MRLRRAARRHKTAVDSEIWYEFQPGDRVLTREGIFGRVVAVEDGPAAGNEQYVVELDAGMGGGEYAASELRHLTSDNVEAGFEAKMSKTAAKVRCPECGQEFNSKKDGESHQLLEAHFGDLEKVSGKEATEVHVASEDYPELGNILEERPPLPHSERIAKVAQWEPITPEIYDRVQLDDGDIGEVIENWWEDDGQGGLIQHFKVQYPDGTIGYGDSSQLGWTNHGDPDGGSDYTHLGSKEAVTRFVVTDNGEVVSDEFTTYGDAVEVFRELNGGDPFPKGNGLEIERVDVPRKEAGFFTDRVLAPAADRMIDNQNPNTRYNPQTGEMASIDWCRFRRDRRCYYPKELNQQATEQAGYAVWIPFDRGLCPRDQWDAQRQCPLSEPGPNSGSGKNLTDVTIPWEQGGQRYDTFGRPVPVNLYASKNYSLVRDPEFQFHFTGAWRDVQEKASRIRRDGHVRVISSTPAYLVGEIRGDTNVYQTILHRDVGSNKVALWECGCAWAAYSWGRSGRWKKYEGRMCSHALALHYEGQSRGWGGQQISEDAAQPSWMSDPSITVKVPGDYKKPDYGEWRLDASRKTADLQVGDVVDFDGMVGTYVGSNWLGKEAPEGRVWFMSAQGDLILANPDELVPSDQGGIRRVETLDDFREVSTDPTLRPAPVVSMIRDMVGDQDDLEEIVSTVASLGVPNASELVKQATRPFEVKWRGVIHRVVETLSGGKLKLDTGEEVPASEVVNPKYDPLLGLVSKHAGADDLDLDWVWQHAYDWAYWGLMLDEDAEAYADWYQEQYREDPSIGDKPHPQVAEWWRADRAREGVKVANADSGEGCMIAFRPPEHILQAFESDEPFEELHVTVAYLGKAAEINKEMLLDAVGAWSQRWPSFPANFSGYGVFENPDNRVLVALVDMPGFEDARSDLLDIMAGYGLHPMRNHGYTPHMTLAYGGEDVTFPDSLPEEAKGDFQFDSVFVVHGREWTEVALTGRTAKKAELNEEPEPALPETTGEDEVDASDFMGDETDLADEPHEVPAAIVQEDEDLRGESKTIEGVSRPEWLNAEGGGKDSSNGDIAAKALETMAKMGLKAFTPEEQRMLIEEGEGVVASNLDLLDLSGTHYEALEEVLQMEDELEDNLT